MPGAELRDERGTQYASQQVLAGEDVQRQVAVVVVVGVEVAALLITVQRHMRGICVEHQFLGRRGVAGDELLHQHPMQRAAWFAGRQVPAFALVRTLTRPIGQHANLSIAGPACSSSDARSGPGAVVQMEMSPMDELERLEALLRSRPAFLSNEQRRAAYDALGDIFPLAGDVRVEPVSAHGVPAEWTSTPVASAREVMLYLHGGGYARGSLQSHRHLASEIGRAATMRTLALDYRRAPEFPFPHALEDAVSGYRFLLESGFAPHQMAVAGDSAGAGLAVALLVRLKELGLQQPACALLLSPWVDMTATADSYGRNAKRDPVLNREVMQFLADQYLGDRPRETPLASPVFADLSGIAPLTIFVGATEALLDDAVALARAAGLADVSVRLEIWPNMFHIWPNYHQVLAQGRQGVDRAGRLLREAVDAAADGTG